MALTTRETKNKILAEMPDWERQDALVGAPPDGYLIVTEARVFEIYRVAQIVYVVVKDTVNSWEDFDL